MNFASVRYITDVIEKFRKQYPRVTYDIVTAPADIVKDQIEKGLIDVGLLLEPISVEKFEYKKASSQRTLGCDYEIR